MFLNAKNGRVQLGTSGMDYVSFGRGGGTLVLLPGLGDGLATVKGMAAALAWAYRAYAKAYTVFVFSRKDELPEGCSTRQMAGDQAEAMRALGLARADVMGVSQGGMIAQYLAIDHPELVRRLVLAVTLAGPNETVQSAVDGWIGMANRGDHRALMIDTAKRSYSEKALKKYRLLYPFLGLVGRPQGYGRFIAQANACVRHDARRELDRIQCPTLVIGGGCDRIVGPQAAAELAGGIRDSHCYIYEGLGHAAYEEAPDFNERVLRFLTE